MSRVLAFGVCLLTVACSDHGSNIAESAPIEPSVDRESSLSWAHHVGQSVLPKSAPSARDMKIEPATLIDTAYSGHDMVQVRRLVYRASLQVPSSLTSHRPPVLSPAGELQVDVADDRIRARFLGPGWPVDDGSEVRLRADVPGVYLFDGDGGRPIGPGHLARWFQGDPSMHSRIDVQVRRDPTAPNEEGPGDLLCALLAEWSQTRRDELMPQCAGTLPPNFRIGAWSMDVTAIVPLTLPRSQLRADSGLPPDPLRTADAHALFEARDLARLLPDPPHAGDEVIANDAARGGGLTIENRTPSRVGVIVQGIPIGWIKPEQSGTFFGLSPGSYHVAVMRPMGTLVMSVAATRVPAKLQVQMAGLVKPEPPAPIQESEPTPNSPDAAR
ncbi:MAG TPA: hypothetical protein VHZ95_10415 [Polyangiales bacterium]|jgi:hypothetical protein|nr:hypothetical protein [Polyangiales bacterium]